MSTVDTSAELDDARWMAARMRSANAGAGVNTAMAYVGQALSLVTVPIYLRYLGQQQYGLMLLLVTLQTYLSQTNLGLNWAAMNMIGAARATGDRRELVIVVQNAVMLAVATAVFALAASVGIAAAARYGLATALRLDEGIDPWAIVAVGGLAALSLAGGPVYLTFVGMGQSSTAAFYQGLGRVLAIPAMATVAWRGGGIANMLGVNAAILTVLLILASAHMLRKFPNLVGDGLHMSGAQCRRQFVMGIKNMSAELGYLLHATAPTLALGTTCGAAAVPLYAVPKSLMDSALTFGRSQNSILQPAYAEAARHGRTGAIARMLSRSLTRNLTLLGVLCAGFIVLCGPFVELWTGGRLEVSRPAAVAVALASPAIFLVQLFQLFLVGTNRQLTAARTLMVSGAASLLLAVLAGSLTGFYGAIYAAAAAALITTLLMGIQTLGPLAVSNPLRRGTIKCAVIGTVFALTLSMGLATYGILQDLLPQTLAMVITAVGMVLLYISIFALLTRVGASMPRLRIKDSVKSGR